MWTGYVHMFSLCMAHEWEEHIVSFKLLLPRFGLTAILPPTCQWAAACAAMWDTRRAGWHHCQLYNPAGKLWSCSYHWTYSWWKWQESYTTKQGKVCDYFGSVSHNWLDAVAKIYIWLCDVMLIPVLLLHCF